MEFPSDCNGVPVLGSTPWRAWWLGHLDRNTRAPRSLAEILTYFRLDDFPLPDSELAKLELRYQEGFWGLVDRSHEVNGPPTRLDRRQP